MRKRPLRNCKLYLVLDKDAAGRRDLAKIARAAVSGGVDMLQLRWKRSWSMQLRWKGPATAAMLKIGARLQKIAARRGILFIINDDPHLAKFLNADGVHLGSEDVSIKDARTVLGPNKIIGYSTHNLPEVRMAASEGADYISVGPIFKTAIKPAHRAVGAELIRKASGRTKIPIFAIGGINLKNIKKVVKYGAGRIAVVRALVNANNPKKTAGLLRQELI